MRKITGANKPRAAGLYAGASTALEFDNHQANQGETQNDENYIDRTHFYVLRLFEDPMTETLALLLARSRFRSEC